MQRKRKKTVAILVPLYNDSHRIPAFVAKVEEIQTKISKRIALKILFVDDGSADGPIKVAKRLKSKIPVCMIVLSRNFGKEAALTAGLDHFIGDGVILIDVDLQDPIELVPKLIDVWLTEDKEVVLARRSIKGGEQNFRRKTSRLYLKFLKQISGLDFPSDVGETRFMSAQVVNEINRLRENQRFVRGLMTWVGFEPGFVDFERKESPEPSRFTKRKLISLALSGVFSFSLTPIRLITVLGVFSLLISLCLALLLIILRINDVVTLPGYSSTLFILLMFSSVQILSIGVIGEYLGRTFLEAKNRSIYVVSSKNEFRN